MELVDVEWCFSALAPALAERVDQGPALVHGDEALSWSEFLEEARAVAVHLQRVGLEPGDRVAFYLRNQPAYLIGLMGCFLGGFVHLNVNYRYREEELGHLLTDSGARAVIVDMEFRPILDAFDAQPALRVLTLQEGAASFPWADALGEAPCASPEDGRMFIYTGGTTGYPKAVVWRETDVIALIRRYVAGLSGAPLPTSVDVYAETLDLDARPVQVVAAPLMHATGLLGALVTLVRGGTVVTVPGSALDPDAIWSAAAASGADSLSIVGDVFARPLLDTLDSGRIAPDTLSRLTTISSSGVAWTGAVKDRLLTHLPWLTLIDGLGATEAPACAAVVSGRGATEGAGAGGFVASEECRVFSADGRSIEPGEDEPGYLALGGPLPLGYWGDEEKSKATFREVDGRRYAFTGDLVRLAADGTIAFLGRGSNCINTGGEKVFPEEVEAVLKAHTDVHDALVFGTTDPLYGERVTALVAAANEATVETLRAAIAAKLAGYKVPREIFFVDAVPRLPNGKADYKAARAMVPIQTSGAQERVGA